MVEPTDIFTVSSTLFLCTLYFVTLYFNSLPNSTINNYCFYAPLRMCIMHVHAKKPAKLLQIFDIHKFFLKKIEFFYCFIIMRQALCSYKGLNHGYIYPYKTPFFLLLSPIPSGFPFLPFRWMLSRRFVHCAAYYAAFLPLPPSVYLSPMYRRACSFSDHAWLFSLLLFCPHFSISFTFPSSKICIYQKKVVSLYPI